MPRGPGPLHVHESPLGQSQLHNRLRGIKWGPHDAVQSAKWAREDALPGKLKTKRRLEAEKLAEEEEEGTYKAGYAEDEEVEVEGTEQGGQMFSAIVHGTGADWEKGDMIMEQGDVWKDEVDSEEE